MKFPWTDRWGGAKDCAAGAHFQSGLKLGANGLLSLFSESLLLEIGLCALCHVILLGAVTRGNFSCDLERNG